MFRQGGCRPLRQNKGKQVALAVARGLGYLHQNGVVHRCVSDSFSHRSQHLRM